MKEAGSGIAFFLVLFTLWLFLGGSCAGPSPATEILHALIQK